MSADLNNFYFMCRTFNRTNTWQTHKGRNLQIKSKERKKKQGKQNLTVQFRATSQGNGYRGKNHINLPFITTAGCCYVFYIVSDQE